MFYTQSTTKGHVIYQSKTKCIPTRSENSDSLFNTVAQRHVPLQYQTNRTTLRCDRTTQRPVSYVWSEEEGAANGLDLVLLAVGPLDKGARALVHKVIEDLAPHRHAHRVHRAVQHVLSKLAEAILEPAHKVN